MDEHVERRLAANEVRFREMNGRRLEEEGDLHGELPEALVVMCECALEECILEFEVPVDAYGRARSDPRRFLVRAGHQLPEVELVVEDLGEERLVVEKVGPGVAVAEGAA